ncbi:MAG TPA: M23 family metallopeptidase [Longimicrobiales bacterium]|nr:M23 family metallopeptidase [Longimicrobiales bacterium]
MPERRFPREAVRLSVAGVLFLVAALGSTAAGLLHEEGDAPRLVQRDDVLRTGPLSVAARVSGPLSRSGGADAAYRLLGALQPLDASLHLAGLATSPDPLDTPDRPAALANEERVYLDTRTLLRRGSHRLTWRELEDSAQAAHERREATPSLFPTRGYVSSGFSRKRWHPILELARRHNGLDIVAPTGTPIVASARGRVRFVGEQGAYGRMVEIDHGYGVVTRYAHASRTLVRRGQLVQRGDTIARVGRTGLAIGSHLHYEVLIDGVPANPNRYVFDMNVIAD